MGSGCDYFHPKSDFEEREKNRPKSKEELEMEALLEKPIADREVVELCQTGELKELRVKLERPVTELEGLEAEIKANEDKKNYSQRQMELKNENIKKLKEELEKARKTTEDQIAQLSKDVAKLKKESLADDKEMVALNQRRKKILDEKFEPEFVKSQQMKFKEVNSADSEGRTCLMWAVGRNDLEMVKFLVNVPGIDLTRKDNIGQTALHKAINPGEMGVNSHYHFNSDAEDLLKILLPIWPKEDIKTKDQEGQTALSLADHLIDDWKDEWRQAQPSILLIQAEGKDPRKELSVVYDNYHSHNKRLLDGMY